MDYMIGKCRFCGSERDVLADDQERADEMVSKECACGRWEEEEDRLRKKFLLKNELARLLGNGCQEMGFTPLSPEVISAAYAVGELIIDEKMEKATLKIGRDSVTITGGAKIGVRRNRKEEWSGEVQ